MKTDIQGKPSFAYIHVDLDPGESIIAEPDAMSSMSTGIKLDAKFNGGFFKGLIKKFLGRESLFISIFNNPTQSVQRVTLTQSSIGDIGVFELNGDSKYMEPGTFIAATEGIKLNIRWAGFASWFSGEGLFKLHVSGKGRVFYGAYGALVEREVDGALLVDTGHLVAYDPQLKLKTQLAGGLFSSLFGGEGFVLRIEGQGKVVLQTRNMGALTSWINARLR
jgi:uncharacterized protein (TIGR00266 family)